MVVHSLNFVFLTEELCGVYHWLLAVPIHLVENVPEDFPVMIVIAEIAPQEFGGNFSFY